MRHCPVCEKELTQEPVCDSCGFDQSCNYEQNRTLCPALPKGAEPVSVCAAKWKRRKQANTETQRALVCPKCGGTSFSFLIDEPQFMCLDCGEKIPVTAPTGGSVPGNGLPVERETPAVPDDPPVTVSTPAGTGSEPAAPEPEPAEPREDPVIPEPKPEPAAIRQRGSKTGLNIAMAAGGLFILYNWYRYTYVSNLDALMPIFPVILVAAVLASAVQVVRSRETQDPRLRSNLFLIWEAALIAVFTVLGADLFFMARYFLDWLGEVKTGVVLAILCFVVMEPVLIVRLVRKLRTAKEAPATPEPSARTWLGDFLNRPGLLRAYFWIYLAAAAGLVLLARIIAWTFRMALVYVPGMLLNAVFYAVGAVLILLCRRRIRGMDAGRADSIRCTAAFLGMLIFIHVLLTAFQQVLVWFVPLDYILDYMMSVPLLEYGYDIRFPIIAFCVIGAVLTFRCRRRIREMLESESAASVRRTAVLFGTLILIRILLDVIYDCIVSSWNYDDFDSFLNWLGDLIALH